MPDQGDDVVRRSGEACQFRMDEFLAILSNHADALGEARDWAWNTMFWGFCFALVRRENCISQAGEGEERHEDRWY